MKIAYKKTYGLIRKYFPCHIINEIRQERNDEQILFRIFFTVDAQIIIKYWKAFLSEFVKIIPYEKRQFLSIELKVL